MEKLFPDPFLKTQNWAYLWINSLKCCTVCFHCQSLPNILKLRCWPLAFNSYKGFLKNKKRSWTSLLASFSAWFLRKSISHVIFYKLTKFHRLVVFSWWDIELLLRPGPRPWTRTLDPGPGPWTRTRKNLDPEEPGPWKTWETPGYGKMIRRPHIITY